VRFKGASGGSTRSCYDGSTRNRTPPSGELPHHSYIRKIPVFACVVEPVADDELRPDVETDVLDIDRDPLDPLLEEERGDLERSRLPDLEALHQVVERQARVDDVLSDQHVPPGDLLVEVLQDPHHAGGLCRGPV